ncbi:MAG: sortase [Chloroflexi bacterium]|nr:sortase [Chloroflexota bacterium]
MKRARVGLTAIAVVVAGCASGGAQNAAAIPVAPAPALAALPISFPEQPTVQEATQTAGLAPLPTSLAALVKTLYGERQIRQLVLPRLNIGAQVVPVGWLAEGAADEDGDVAWESPEGEIGWVVNSALPDMPGNVILYAHNNLYGEVFRDLSTLEAGDYIYLETGAGLWQYAVTEVHVLLVFGAAGADEDAFEEYLWPEGDERLTLVSCWPPVSNTHRVVVVAIPANDANGQ